MVQPNRWSIGGISHRKSEGLRAVIRNKVRACMIKDSSLSIERIAELIGHDKSIVSVYYIKFKREGLRNKVSGQKPVYLMKKEEPNEEILKIVKEKIENNKGIHQIHNDTELPLSTVRRYYWQVLNKKW